MTSIEAINHHIQNSRERDEERKRNGQRFDLRGQAAIGELPAYCEALACAVEVLNRMKNDMASGKFDKIKQCEIALNRIAQLLEQKAGS